MLLLVGPVPEGEWPAVRPVTKGECPVAVSVTIPVVAEAVIVLAVFVFWSKNGPSLNPSSVNLNVHCESLESLLGS